MANEDKKDFNAMLHDNKDMPKFQIITDEKSIEKYGGNRMYFAPPIAYDEVMKKIPYGKVPSLRDPCTVRQRFGLYTQSRWLSRSRQRILLQGRRMRQPSSVPLQLRSLSQ